MMTNLCARNKAFRIERNMKPDALMELRPIQLYSSLPSAKPRGKSTVHGYFDLTAI